MRRRGGGLDWARIRPAERLDRCPPAKRAEEQRRAHGQITGDNQPAPSEQCLLTDSSASSTYGPAFRHFRATVLVNNYLAALTLSRGEPLTVQTTIVREVGQVFVGRTIFNHSTSSGARAPATHPLVPLGLHMPCRAAGLSRYTEKKMQRSLCREKTRCRSELARKLGALLPSGEVEPACDSGINLTQLASA